jgi:succinate dehydrogenase / fumarate reductase flavoprotein subunit
MWERCGVVRNEADLRHALAEISDIREASDGVDVRPGAEGWSDLANLLDLRAGLIAAEATVRGAIERRETRGAHNRLDFPELDPSAIVNLYGRLEPDGRSVRIWSEPVPSPSAELDLVLRTAPEVHVTAEHLVE